MPKELHQRRNGPVENLIASTLQMATGSETLKKGSIYPRGSVLGYLPSEDKCVFCDKKNQDNSAEVYAILAEDVDATNDDVKAPVWYDGSFFISGLTFAPGNTAADHKLDARNRRILFVE